jgi:small subunit ribosomal protein S18e
VYKIVAVVSKPLEFKIPAWMLNRQRDVKDGKTSQKYANFLDQALREETELNQFV